MFQMNRTFSRLTIFGSLFLLNATQAFAQAAVPAGPPPQPTFAELFPKMIPMFVMVFAVFYLFVIKPQQSKVKEQTKLLEGLKKGETVVTSGGIIGRVASVETDHILVEIATNVKIKVEKSSIFRKDDKRTDTAKAA